MAPDLFRPLWWWLGVDGPGAYTTMQWLSLFTSVPLAFWAARRRGLSWGRFGVLCALTYLTALCTSKLTWVFTVAPPGFVHDGVALDGVVAFWGRVLLPPWTGGQVFYGSVLGVGLAALAFGPLVYGRAWGETALRYLDVTVIPLVSISAIGRVGCHLAGCCFGRVAPEGLGVRFPPTSEPVRFLVEQGHLDSVWQDSAPLVPTQLLEAATSAGLVVFLVTRLRNRWPPGTLALVGLSAHAAIRFGLEFFRFDPRGAFGPLSTSQWLGLFVVGVLLTTWWPRRPRATAAEAPT